MSSILRIKPLAAFVVLVGLSGPAAALTLNDGDLVVVDAGSDAPVVPPRVIRIDPSTGAQQVVSSGGQLIAPVAIAIEDSGMILVADSGVAGEGAVIRIDPANGAQTILSPSYAGLLGLALRPTDGAIFVTDSADVVVYQVNPTTGARTPTASGSPLTFPQAITTAPDGFLYVANFSSVWTVLQIDPTSGAQVPFAGGFQFVGGLAASTGALWVTDATSGSITRVDLTTEDPTPVSSGGDLLFPFGIAVEGSGQLVVADWGNTTVGPAVVRVNPTTGAQSIVSPGGFLTEPWGIAVVAPEPSTALLGLGALAALVALRRRAD